MEEKFSEIAAMIGEPVRAKVLWALLDGRAYTAHELAVSAGEEEEELRAYFSIEVGKLRHA